MKNLISTILLLLVTLPILAQERRLEQVDERLFSYREYSGGGISQSGYYEKINDQYVPTGMWRNSVGTTAYFKNGEMLWIKMKGEPKVSKQQIEIHRLKKRIAKLEEALTSL